MNPFLDIKGLFRVGGRLNHSNLSYEQKHPIILPSSHKLTKHNGPQNLLHGVPQTYWALKGKYLARRIVHNCIICFKSKPVISNQIMGDLPSERGTKIVQIIWHNWSKDYLNHLNQRHKWQFKKQNVMPGTLVLLKEENLPPCKWSIGRIVQTIYGHDDTVRVVIVKTPKGEFKRPISKISIFT